MKLKKIVALSLVTAMVAVGGAACGKKSDDASASTEETTVAETLAADDPDVVALEATEVPEKPALEDMGTIKLTDYKGIEVQETEQDPVTDEQVDSMIQNILEQNLTEVTDRPSQSGDTVNIDYVGKVDDKEFDGGSAEGYDLELGSGRFIDNFEEQLEGHVAGDKVTVNVTFPEDYSNTDLAGKAAVFDVTINKVSAPAELTDEFVQGYSEKSKTVAEFREEQRQLLQNYADYTMQDQIRSDVLEAVVSASEFEPSDALLDYMNAYMINSMVNEYKMYGMGMADMLNMYGMSVADFKDQVNSMAEQNAKYEMALAQIAADENIVMNDAVLEDFAKEFSMMSEKEYTAADMKEQFGEKEVQDAAIQNAVLKVLEDNAKVTYVKAEETSAADASEAESTEAESTETESAAEAETSAAE